MGWIRGQANEDPSTQALPASGSYKQSGLHVENFEQGTKSPTGEISQDDSGRPYPFLPKGTSDVDCPFIGREEVLSKRRPNAKGGKELNHEDNRKDMWVVIDDWVYDCSDFILKHPGGRQFILFFVGEDATWQFYRFHGRDILAQYQHLRIGKTKDAMVRFKKPPQFAGRLRSADEW